MRRFIILLQLCVLLFSFSNISAQIIAFENPEAELQRARIGLVDEFIKRFNGNEIHPDIEPSKRDSLNRNLLWLFDQEQFLNPDLQIQDSIRSEALNLIEVIQNDSIKINYSDTTWVAIAHCKGIVMGEPEKFDIFLTVQSRGEDMYKWVINTVDGECFSIEPNDVNDNLIISPDAHETKFITLNRISKEQPHNIRLFLSKNIKYDPISVFSFLVYSGKLKIDYIERLEFVFLQVPNYAFHIQYFDRQSNNSGWLISNFYPFSDSDKLAFRKMINQDTSIGNLSKSAQIEKLPIEGMPQIFPDSIANNLEEPMSVNRLLINRINERLKLVQDYIQYIESITTDKSTQQYYAQKLLSLFSNDAKAIIKNSRTGEVKGISIKKFTDSLIDHKFVDLALEAITSAIIKKSDSERENPIVISTGIIPFYVMGSDEVLKTISDKMLPCHPEDTEDGVEYLFDFGDIYISVK